MFVLMRWAGFSTALLLSLVVSGCAKRSVAVDTTNTEAALQPLPEAEVHRPSKLPDRIVLTWSGDPARSQSVTWRTDTSVAVGLAEIAIADDDASFIKRSRQLKAKTSVMKSDLSTAHYHSVEFQALTPRTKYAYRVGDGANWSEWFHITTASDVPEPFSFVYFGDAQNDVKSLWSRVIREAFVDAPKAKFLLHAGDLINRANNDAHWGEWFQAGGWLNGMIPSVPTPGNHEYLKVLENPNAAAADQTYVTVLSNHWRPQFTLPENGPAGLEETTFFMDFQGVRIVSLNSNEKQAEQVPWLETVLKNNPCRWTILTFHHPIYSAAKSRDNVKLREFWQPIFDKYKVDLVLQGHDHSYARSGLQTAAPSEIAKNDATGVTGQNQAGTVYVVSVSGPKMYDLGKPIRPEFQRVAEDTQLFQVITIDGGDLTYVAKTATGQLYDGFTLRKREGQSNELIEQIPETTQRLRPSKAPAADATK